MIKTLDKHHWLGTKRRDEVGLVRFLMNTQMISNYVWPRSARCPERPGGSSITGMYRTCTCSGHPAGGGGGEAVLRCRPHMHCQPHLALQNRSRLLPCDVTWWHFYWSLSLSYLSFSNYLNHMFVIWFLSSFTQPYVKACVELVQFAGIFPCSHVTVTKYLLSFSKYALHDAFVRCAIHHF